MSKVIVFSQGGHNSSIQNSESSAQNQNQNQSPPVSPRGGNTQTNMVGIDNTLRLPEFKGVGLEDLEQHLFVYEIVWAAENIHDELVKIVQLEITFRGCALVWYMKLQGITSTRQAKNLVEIKKALLKEFKKPNSKSQYITELKEIK